MVGQVVLPRVTTMAQAGVQPVSTINKVDPNGPMLFRMNGDVGRLLACYPEVPTKWQKVKLKNFHRYCFNDCIVTFDNDDCAAKGLRKRRSNCISSPHPASTVSRRSERFPRKAR